MDPHVLLVKNTPPIVREDSNPPIAMTAFSMLYVSKDFHCAIYPLCISFAFWWNELYMISMYNRYHLSKGE